MKPILALNAFDTKYVSELGGELGGHLRQRTKVFGAASVLFYDRPLELVRGEGCWLYDTAGTAYLDAYNNVPSVGHCHPRVLEAAVGQLRQLNTHARYVHRGSVAFAERLLGTLPPELSNITFTCTGSESNDLALRQAALFTGAQGIIVTETAYHGNTGLVTAVSPSSFTRWRQPAHVRVVPAPDAARAPAGKLGEYFAGQVAAAIADLERHGLRVSALLLDSIFSSDGVFADPPGFLAAAVDVVHRAHGLFIADEVQSGFARTGTSMWGFGRHAVTPDIVTMGKAMGNGFPLGAVVTRPEILASFCREVGYFNTCAGSPVAAAVGQAVLDVIEQEGLMQNAARVGGHLQRELASLAGRHQAIGEVRGAGLYIGVQVRDATGSPSPALAAAIINGLRERHVLIGAAGKDGSILKLRPPLCFSTAHADQLVAALDEVLASFAGVRA
jgi:4-aminobutyrate aminotransferase-like enzyme